MVLGKLWSHFVGSGSKPTGPLTSPVASLRRLFACRGKAINPRLDDGAEIADQALHRPSRGLAERTKIAAVPMPLLSFDSVSKSIVNVWQSASLIIGIDDPPDRRNAG